MDGLLVGCGVGLGEVRGADVGAVVGGEVALGALVDSVSVVVSGDVVQLRRSRRRNTRVNRLTVDLLSHDRNGAEILCVRSHRAVSALGLAARGLCPSIPQ